MQSEYSTYTTEPPLMSHVQRIKLITSRQQLELLCHTEYDIMSTFGNGVVCVVVVDALLLVRLPRRTCKVATHLS